MKIACYSENIEISKLFVAEYIICNGLADGDVYKFYSSARNLVIDSKSYDLIIVVYENEEKRMNLHTKSVYVKPENNDYELYLFVNSVRLKKLKNLELANSYLTYEYNAETASKYFENYFPVNFCWNSAPVNDLFKVLFKNYLIKFLPKKKEDIANYIDENRLLIDKYQVVIIC